MQKHGEVNSDNNTHDYMTIVITVIFINYNSGCVLILTVFLCHMTIYFFPFLFFVVVEIHHLFLPKEK